MDPADTLLDKIFSLVDLEAHSADELNKLAVELEEQRKAVNISQVAGSAVSAVGSAALLTAGLLLSGGTAVPFLAVGGKVVSWLGVGVNIGSEVVDGVNTEKDKKEKEIYEKIENLKKEIQTPTESLADEGEKAGVPENAREEYVTERILRALAKRHGLMIDTKVTKWVIRFLKQEPGSGTVLRYDTISYLLISRLVLETIEIQAGKKAGYMAVTSSAFEASKQAVKKVGSEASSKALKRITQGTFGLVFSGAELIYNCATLNKCETDKSKSLRKRSKEMKTHAENMKKELDAIERMFEELAEVKNAIENKERSSRQKKKLIDFAKKQCKDEAVKAWLEETEKSGAFLSLIDMFKFLTDEIDKAKEKIVRENIDVIFVAHGSIEYPLIPASCLLPLPTIQDVVLYTPWNCALIADAAYGIATGRLQPKHRVFFCGDEESCEVKEEGHQPTKLPADWNSMKAAGEGAIANISVSPLRKPEDGAWNYFEFLQDKHGPPGRNRVLIPFILPGVSDDFEVPFFVITLALSLVLYFSGYKATIHLAACLGRSETISDRFKRNLNRQYSYTIDKTGMTSSEEMLDETPLSKLFKTLFG